ncbi:MAG: hypothetical protein ACFBZ8_03285 [Opitutales bacterium]
MARASTGELWYFADDGAPALALRKLNPSVTSPFEKWLDETTTLVGTDRDPKLDPNNNTQTTGFDYATGLDADTPRTPAMTTSFALIDAVSNTATFTCPRWRDFEARALDYQVMVSTDLVSWTDFPLSDVDVRVLSEDFEEVAVEIVFPTLGGSGPRLFASSGESQRDALNHRCFRPGTKTA